MPADTRINEILREHDYRVTPGRVALLAALKQAKKPLSAEALTKTLKGKLDQANAYRALESFSRKGLVRRVDVGHQHMHYELTKLVPHHHHYVCVDCGARQNTHI